MDGRAACVPPSSVQKKSGAAPRREKALVPVPVVVARSRALVGFAGGVELVCVVVKVGLVARTAVFAHGCDATLSHINRARSPAWAHVRGRGMRCGDGPCARDGETFGGPEHVRTAARHAATKDLAGMQKARGASRGRGIRRRYGAPERPRAGLAGQDERRQAHCTSQPPRLILAAPRPAGGPARCRAG